MSKGNRVAEKFYWDNPSTALHLQTSIPLKIQVGSKTFATKSWSLSGFKLSHFKANQTGLIGKTFPATLRVHFRDFDISIDTVAVVKHYDSETQELEADFKVLKEEHKELLRYFIQSIASGEMTTIDNVIRRVDMPVESPSIKIPNAETANKTGTFSMLGLYWLAGLLLLGYLLFSLYSSHYRMEVTSAVISQKVLSVQSNINGSISALALKAGDAVQAGVRLASMKATPSENNANDAEKNPQSYEADIREVQELLAIQENKLSAYHQEAESDIQQAKVQYAAAKERQNLAQTTVDRMRNLLSQGVISAMDFKQHQEDLLKAQEDTAVAKIELSKQQDILNNVNKGYIYNGKNLDNEREKLLAKLNTLKRKQQQAQDNEPVDNTTPPGTTAVKSPVEGILKEWLIDESQYVHIGQPLAKLIDTSEKPYIDAFLTQEEVNGVGLQADAVAYIPALDQSFPVKVTYLDRTSGFFEEVNNRFDWRNPEEKTARVKLEFTTSPAESVTPGLPVVVNFSKNTPTSTGFFSWLRDLFSDTKSQPNQPSDNSIQACQQALWPKDFALNRDSQQRLPKVVLDNLIAKADAALDIKPQALKNLNSAGVIDPDDKDLLKTREALQDSQRSVLLAMAYRLTDKDSYRKQAEAILLAWAQTYQPSGHPIDETKLDAILWAYDLLKCELSADNNKTIQSWLKEMQTKKQNWAFGDSSNLNNWKTHQLKMQLMLDKLLNDQASLEKDIKAINQHLSVNILKDGATFDYEERKALHYHVYDLEAWLDIALLAPSYQSAVKPAFDFLIKKLENREIDQQFVGSKQAIDEKRAKAGFEYAKKGGTYEPEKAARALLGYATLQHTPLQQVIPSPYASAFTEEAFEQSFFAYLRYYLWTKNNG